MRQVIEQMAQGRFADERPKLNMDEACISVRMGKNEIYEGSLTLETVNGQPVRGTVFCSTPRVTLRNSEISGSHAEMIYTISSIGLDAGEELNGSFTLVTDGGEYEVPFFVKIVKVGSTSSMGNVKNLFHFTNLAYTDYEEAFQIFSSDSFVQIFSDTEDAERTLYECLKKTGLTRSAMEEFLIGIHKKKRSFLKLSQTHLKLTDMKETQKGSIPLEKENWGYLCADVSSDAPFLILNRKKITTDDFVGKYYDFPFLVEASRLHAGKNFGTICIRTKTEELKFTVEAEGPVTEEKRAGMSDARRVQELKVQLMQSFIRYRTKQTQKDSWTAQSQELLEELSKRERLNPYYPIVKAYFYCMAGEKEKARQVLGYFSRNEQRLQEPLFYSAYTWLTCLLSDDREYEKKACKNIRMLYERNRDCWQILWILLQMEEFQACGPVSLLEYMEEQIDSGCASPVFLAESFLLLQRFPQLLKKLNRARVRIFLWASRMGLVDETLAVQIGSLACQSRDMGRIMLRLLMLLYDRYPRDEILTAVISTLVRSGCRDPRFFHWFREGVEKDLKIAGLYEAYICTVNEKLRKRLPTPLVLYFQYNNTLDYRKKAFFYANLYQFRKSYGTIYRQFEPQIEKFVTEQLMARHMDRNLARLYNGFLKEDMLTRDLVKALTSMLFLREVHCRNRSIQKVTAVHKYVDTWQTAAVTEQTAFLNIYMEDCKLVFEDDRGELSVSEEDYEVYPLLDTERFLPVCESFFPEDGMLIMYRCCGRSDYYVIREDNVRCFTRLVNLPFVETGFREKVRGDILAYYYDNYEVETLEESLFEIDPGSLNAADRVRLAEICISRKMYDRAYEILKEYGYERVSPKKLVRLCTRMIRRAEYEKDPYLLALCFSVFGQGKYDETMLQYLCDYYSGKMSDMRKINEAADNFEMQSFYLKERILIQRLFTGVQDLEDFPIFQAYMHMGGSELVEKAYLSFHSHLYFMDQEKGERGFFEALQKKYMETGLDSDVCRLSLLKYYAEHPGMRFGQEELVERLLDEMALSDYRFAFYQKFPSVFLEPYFIEDKYFVEYRTVPGRRVYLHFRLLEAEKQKSTTMVTEKLPEVFPGIYSREFTLFYGDELIYFISETCPDGTKKQTDEVRIRKDDVFLSEKKDRYHLINDMLICQDLHDELTLKELEHTYRRQEAMVKAFFHLEESGGRSGAAAEEERKEYPGGENVQKPSGEL